MTKIGILMEREILSMNLSSRSTLCLGFSGGPDSTALLHLLHEQMKDFSLCLAHVNHGWREESKQEGLQIKEMASSLGHALFQKELQIDVNESNLEDHCRRKRLEFFYDLYQKNRFDVLLLAHQADDQAETVLKRVFEGANLPKVGGLKRVSYFRDMPILRPLLDFSKKQLIEYLNDKEVSYFEDPTNLQPRFLRGRLRSELLPDIEKKFGKNIQKNLWKLGARCQEIDDYLARKIDRFYSVIRREEEEVFIDFLPFFPLERVEIEYFIRRLLEDWQETISFEQVKAVISFICEKAYNKKILGKNLLLYVHGGTLTLKKLKAKNMEELKDKFSRVC